MSRVELRVFGRSACRGGVAEIVLASSSAIAADGTASPEPGSAKRSSQLVVFWCATAALYLTLIWLYGRSVTFPALSLGDETRLSEVGALPFFDALLHAGSSPLRPGDNAWFWLLAHSDRLVAGRAALLGMFLLTTAFVQYYASERGESWIAGVCSAWCFALNPTTASVVCWLSGAHVALCALGVLTYVECSQRLLNRSPTEPTRALDWAGALGGLSFALAFYELAVLAPLLVVLDWALLKPRAAASTLQRLLVASGLCVAAFVALQLASGARADGWFGDSPALRAASAPRYYLENFMLWMWPWGRLGVGIPDAPSAPAIANTLCAALVLTTWTMLWKLRRWDPVSAFGFAWFILFLIPAFALPEPIAPYHLYLPMLGFVFAGARVTLWVLERASTSIRRPRLRLGFDVLVSVFFLWTFAPLVDETMRTLEAWGDEEQLYLLTLQNYPNHIQALARLSLWLAAKPPAVKTPAQSSWEQFVDESLMRPLREPPAALIAQGRQLAEQRRDAESGSAFARALAAGARGDERLAAGSGLARALSRLNQPASAAAWSARLQSEYPTPTLP